jgi:hypothetical protein
MLVRVCSADFAVVDAPSITCPELAAIWFVTEAVFNVVPRILETSR